MYPLTTIELTNLSLNLDVLLTKFGKDIAQGYDNYLCDMYDMFDRIRLTR